MTERAVERGDVVWTPPQDVLSTTVVGEFLDWVATHRGRRMSTHNELWEWSVRDLPGFWSAIWEFFGVRTHTPYENVLADASMPGAQWFPGATLNYAEHALGDLETGSDADEIAVLGRSQTRADVDLTWAQLREQVARARRALADLGVARGDRVAGYVPNIPEALVAFLATASLGATWASCATEFGPRSVIDRFAQIEPSVLLVVGGYRYGTKDVDRAAEVQAVRAELPTVRHVVDLGYGDFAVPDALSWPDLLAAADPAQAPPFEAVPFDHPLVVLFSWHDRAAQGHRPRPRRHPVRAPEEPRALLGHAPRRPDAVVQHDRLDDVERPGLLAARAGLDRHDRRQPDVSGCRVAVGAGRGDRRHDYGRQPGLDHGLPQGGRRPARA